MEQPGRRRGGLRIMALSALSALIAPLVFVGIIVLILLPWLRRQIAETDAPSPSKPE